MLDTKLIAGVDEAGRGPLAGPVVAAAVILDPHQPIAGLADSKVLSAKKRENLYALICARAACYAIASASVEEIDTHNILQASLLAMQRAVLALRMPPQLALIDGQFCPALACETRTVIQGDATIAEISAASILAKVTRDRWMIALDADYPQYGFAQHKGYPTKAHIAAILAHGVLPIHRQSFGPVRRALQAR